MHFDSTISWAILFTLLGILWTMGKLLKVVIRAISLYGVEHEMLITWYCKELNIRPEDLPTRVRTKPI